MSALGEALRVARRARGINQADLADQVGITQAALSRYENGLRQPDDATLERFASALGVTVDLLSSSQRLAGAMAVDAHMRRRATAPATVWRRLEARLHMHRLHTHRILNAVDVNTEQTVPQLDLADIDPAGAARLVRMQWRMPIGAVHGLISWLEHAGCVVIEEDFGTLRVDGMSQWIADHPVVYINSAMPTDRKRLTLAHELGHLVMHSDAMHVDPEPEANAFAAEFLMPADVIRPQLRRLTIPRLLELKRVWQVSMQALIERAWNLGTITATDRTRLYKQFGARGWRRAEPGSEDLPTERPTMTANIGKTLAGMGLTNDEITRLAGYSDSSQPNPYTASDAPHGLRVVSS